MCKFTKEEISFEYKKALKILKNYAADDDKKKSDAAKRILEDKDLLIKYCICRIKRKKEEKKSTGWKNMFKLSLSKLVA